MAKEGVIEFRGQIVEILPNTTFRVRLDDINEIVIGYLNGRMRQHNIKVLLGDNVLIEFSPYDLARGRIIRRL